MQKSGLLLRTQVRLVGLSLLAASTTFMSCSRDVMAPTERETAPTPNFGAAPIAGQYIVVLKDVDSTDKAADAESLTGEDVNYRARVGHVRNQADGVMSRRAIRKEAIGQVYGAALRGFSARLTPEQAAELAKDTEVAYVEADQMATISQTTTTTTTQPAQTVPAGVNRVGRGDGTGKTAWIIDTGIELTHPDLNVDKVRSRSFLTSASGTGYDSPNDQHGHGTAVAGVIGAKNNTIGVVGVAANANVVALRAMDAKGTGPYSAIIAAVDYVTANGRAGDVVNMSLGGSTSSTLDAAVVRAANKGILFSIAAGNNAGSSTLNSPARVNHANVFTISAMDNTDTWASFSNFGNTTVDYCMPGVGIGTTYRNGGYARMTGTSFAAPHMTGVMLLRGKLFAKSGLVKNDPDGKVDPIAHL